MAKQEFWLKQPFETPYQYNAFVIYRELGVARRLRTAAEEFYREKAEREGNEGANQYTDFTLKVHQYETFRRWSSKNMWTARCEAYDAEMALLREQTIEQHRVEMIETHRKIARNTLAAVADRLRDYARGEDKIPNSQMASMISAATYLERLTLGEATERSESKDITGAQEFDFSKLSDEELDEYLRINEKLMSG